MNLLYLTGLLLFCHFLGDFTPLGRNARMIEAKRYGTPIMPILAHASRHAIMMLFAMKFWCWMFDVTASYSIIVWLFFFQWLMHFSIDIMKGLLTSWFPVFEDDSKEPKWILFGFDQFLHGITILLMVGKFA